MPRWYRKNFAKRSTRSIFDDTVTQYRDWGIPLDRRFRALKLWYHISIDGIEAIQTRLRRDLDNVRWFAEQVAQVFIGVESATCEHVEALCQLIQLQLLQSDT